MHLEGPVKMIEVGKSAGTGDFGDGKAGCTDQQLFCLDDTRVKNVFLAYLCFLSVQFMMTTSKHTIFFRLHYAYIFLAPALGFFSMTLYSVIYFIESFVHPDRYNQRYLKSYDDEDAGEKEGQQ